jgi:Zn-dependent peptidase ImmA (M78 family)
MPSIRVDISPSIVDWIFKVASVQLLDEAWRSRCNKWKTAEEKPTFSQIESLSKKTHIPLGYFFLKAPPVETLPAFEYRTINSAAPDKTPSRNLIDIYYQMSAIQDWMRDYLVESGHGKLFYIGSCKQETNTEFIAKSIRNTAGLKVDWYSTLSASDNPFNILRSLFENIGILVLQNGIVGNNTHRKLDIDEFRAFTLFDEFSPLVFLNSNDTNNGKIFSLVHEAAHIWMGGHSFFNYSFDLQLETSALEKICNAVAAEIIIPNSYFIQEWNRQNYSSLLDKVSQIAKKFRCSRFVVTRRALDNAFISQEDYIKLNDMFPDSIKQKNNTGNVGGDYYKTTKSRYGLPLLRALDNSIKEGRTLYTEAYRLTHTNRISFDKLITEAGSI